MVAWLARHDFEHLGYSEKHSSQRKPGRARRQGWLSFRGPWRLSDAELHLPLTDGEPGHPWKEFIPSQQHRADQDPELWPEPSVPSSLLRQYIRSPK